MPAVVANPLLVPAASADEDPRWAAVRRIVESEQFRRSQRLSGLLLYLAEQTILGRAERLTESNIAAAVFERREGFDPAVDTIVRSHMVRLRQKLEGYAAQYAETETLRVLVPKGEYVVHFEAAPAPVREVPEVALPLPVEAPTPSLPKNLIGYLLIACALGVAAGVLLTRSFRMPHYTAPAAAAAVPPHPLWSRFFAPHEITTFVAADSGLVMLHHMTRQSTTLAEYLSRDFSRETHGLSPERIDEVIDMADRRYTSFVDLNMFHRLEHLPWVASGRLELKYARDLHMDDLKQGNVIFSGARGANPWIELYQPQMNFIGFSDPVHRTYSYINRHPEAGEAARFSVTSTDPQQRVVGVLAFLANLDGSGNALVIEGNSMAGTEAISDFVFDDHALLPFLSKVRRPDGTLQHFEVLIASTSINGSAGPFRIVAWRVHP